MNDTFDRHAFMGRGGGDDCFVVFVWGWEREKW